MCIVASWPALPAEYLDADVWRGVCRCLRTAKVATRGVFGNTGHPPITLRENHTALFRRDLRTALRRRQRTPGVCLLAFELEPSHEVSKLLAAMFSAASEARFAYGRRAERRA